MQPGVAAPEITWAADPAQSSPLVKRRRLRSSRSQLSSFRVFFRQHFGEEGAVDIAAGLDNGDPLAGEATPFL